MRAARITGRTDVGLRCDRAERQHICPVELDKHNGLMQRNMQILRFRRKARLQHAMTE